MSRGLWIRCLACVALSLAAATSGWLVAHELLPERGAVARGLRLGELEADGRVGAGELARRRSEQLLDRKLQIVHGDATVLEVSLRELGAEVDEPSLVASLEAIGRRGTLWQRLDDAWRARQGQLAMTIPLRLPLEPLARRLEEFKRREDAAPVPARWDFARQAPTQHADGRLLDVPALTEALRAAALDGRKRVELPFRRVTPRATRDALAAADFSVEISSYETRYAFVGGEASRAKNVSRAAEGLHGLVLMPGATVSFNDLVGPRSLENGFAKAGEIYRGEMRMGVGGGTCQVASTFHAAAYLGGMTIVERSPHSRPSGYIGLGLDATVAYPHVDLQLKNPFPFPVLVRSEARRGVMRLTLFGEERPVDVDLRVSTVGVARFEREIRETSWLPEGKVIKKQKGIRGVTVEKTRLLRYGDGSTSEEVSTDTYPPTDEVFLVAPGTDLDDALPPLPEGAKEPDSAT